MRVDLLFFPAQGLLTASWSLGATRALVFEPRVLAPMIDAWLERTPAEYVLFWDMQLGAPDPARVEAVLQLPGDAWHAGLCLGMQGLPQMIDFVNPTWMLNRDPAADIVASSWRLSLGACLVKTEVLRQLGTIDPAYDTLAGAALDMGHRWISRGAIVRHAADLLGHRQKRSTPAQLTVYDELRFIGQQYGWRWVLWSLWRSRARRYPAAKLLRDYIRLRREGINQLPAPYNHPTATTLDFNAADWHDKVTVLIPTLERYPYLWNELEQLRDQTVRPLEIIVVDQTPLQERDTTVPAHFADLPLRVIYQETQGQCTAWNAGLLAAQGAFILFLGDDADQIEPDFLERFLRTFRQFSPDMVASVVEEVGAGQPPFNCTFLRVSDIFPITMVTRRLLERSGLMDYAYDRASRADGDLGMRCYLAGALMLLDPGIHLLHHHAPKGGLRAHKARVITSAGSRRSLTQRNLPAVSEIYLALRYFTPAQTRESLLLRVFSLFSGQGGAGRRLLKLAIITLFLPNTLQTIRDRSKQAMAMFNDFPKIPELNKPALDDQSFSKKPADVKQISRLPEELLLGALQRNLGHGE